MARYDDCSKEYLALKCRDLSDKIEELENENSEQRGEIQHLKFRIENELEPRIKSERRAYDRWVTDPERS